MISRRPLLLAFPALLAGCTSAPPADETSRRPRIPEAVRAHLGKELLRGVDPASAEFDAAIDLLDAPEEILAHIRTNSWESGQLDRFTPDRRYMIVRCTDGKVRSAHFRKGVVRSIVELTPARERVLRRLYGPGSFAAGPPAGLVPWLDRPAAEVDAAAELERAIAVGQAGPLAADEETLRRARENLAACGARAVEFGLALGALRESAPSEELCGAAVWVLSRLDRMKFRREGDKGSIPDAETADARQFYENVFYAVRARHAFPWGQEATPEEFRLHVLNPRLTDEPLQRWRRHFYEALEPEVRGLTDREEAIAAARHACYDFFQYEGDTTWEDFGMLTALAVHEGRCEDCSNVENAMLRAIGIPGCQAFTPWWGHANGNHAWTWVPRSKAFSGDGGYGVKVFVKTVDRLEDVTAQHTPVASYTVETGGNDGDDAQLMVWNHEEWRRVWGAKVAGGRVTWERVGCRRPFLLLTRVAGQPDVLVETGKDGTMRVLATGSHPDGPGGTDVVFDKVCALGEFTAETTYEVRTWDGKEWATVPSRRLQTGAIAFSGRPDRAYRIIGEEFSDRPFTLSTDPASESPIQVR